MIGILIFILILGLIFFLLMTHVTFIINFDNTFSITCRFLFFKFKIFPRKEKSKNEFNSKKLEDNSETKGKYNKIKSLVKQNGVGGFLNVVGKLFIILKNSAVYFLKHICIKNFNLNIIISEEDAARTAIKYGQACTIVYPCTDLIFKNSSSCKNAYKINIFPDFDEKGTSKVRFDSSLKIRLIYIIKCTVIAFFKITQKMYILEKVKKQEGVKNV